MKDQLKILYTIFNNKGDIITKDKLIVRVDKDLYQTDIIKMKYAMQKSIDELNGKKYESIKDMAYDKAFIALERKTKMNRILLIIFIIINAAALFWGYSAFVVNH